MRVQFRSNCCPCNVELTKGINFLDAPHNVVKVLLDSKTRRNACRVSVEKAQQGWVNRRGLVQSTQDCHGNDDHAGAGNSDGDDFDDGDGDDNGHGDHGEQ